MPGPLWRHAVDNLAMEIDRRGQIADALGQGTGDDDKIEIFKNANTVVEVSIKTKKPKDRQQQKKQRGRSVVRSRVVSHHPGQSREKTWNHLLHGHQHEPSENLEPGSSSVVRPGRHRTSRDVGTSDYHKSERKQAAKSLLSEMKRLVRDDTKSVDRGLLITIIEELETAEEKRSLKENKHRATSKKIEELENLLQQSRDHGNEQEKRIEQLKGAVTRLTSNNSQMVELLAKNVEMSDSFKGLQEEHAKLLQEFMKEKAVCKQLKAKVDHKEEENKNLRKTILDMQLSLSKDLKFYTSPPPPTLPEMSNISFKTDDAASTPTEADSAIDDGSSHPSSRSQTVSEALKRTNEIITKAKNVLEINAEEIKRPDKGIAEHHVDGNDRENRGSMPNLQLECPAQTMSNPSPSINEETIKGDSAKEDQRRAPMARVSPKAYVNVPDVEKFFQRMKTDKKLNVTLPELPTFKDFNKTGHFTEFTGATDPNSSVASLSESKFLEGLESSILLSSEHD